MPFWGGSHGLGLVLLFEAIFQWGTDIVSLTIRKKTGRNVGSIFSGQWDYTLIAGFDLGWKLNIAFTYDYHLVSSRHDAALYQAKRCGTYK